MGTSVRSQNQADSRLLFRKYSPALPSGTLSLVNCMLCSKAFHQYATCMASGKEKAIELLLAFEGASFVFDVAILSVTAC